MAAPTLVDVNHSGDDLTLWVFTLNSELEVDTDALLELLQHKKYIIGVARKMLIFQSQRGMPSGNAKQTLRRFFRKLGSAIHFRKSSAFTNFHAEFLGFKQTQWT